MKLYTEEQVNEIIDIAEFNKHLTHDDILKEFTPIELPSDEEIEARARGYSDYTYGQAGFIRGTQYMKEQILNQNK